jgi:hypothetical protein
MYPNQRYIVVF